jgi:DNA-directed RNA polymerase specialized sigma24 family protein
MPVSNDFVARLTESQRQVHAFIYSLVWNPADADDILQEANLVLLQKAEAFDGSRAKRPGRHSVNSLPCTPASITTMPLC